MWIPSRNGLSHKHFVFALLFLLLHRGSFYRRPFHYTLFSVDDAISALHSFPCFLPLSAFRRRRNNTFKMQNSINRMSQFQIQEQCFFFQKCTLKNSMYIIPSRLRSFLWQLFASVSASLLLLTKLWANSEIPEGGRKKRYTEIVVSIWPSFEYTSWQAEPNRAEARRAPLSPLFSRNLVHKLQRD